VKARMTAGEERKGRWERWKGGCSYTFGEVWSTMGGIYNEGSGSIMVLS
jgi:hypothetical protein